MEPREIDPDGTWAPEACTLTAAELPQRSGEFDRLFADAVRGIERTAPTRLRLDLRPDPQVAGRAAELVTAETGCCSFFTFVITITDGRLILDVTVPAAQAGLLDTLAGHAATASGAGGMAP